MGLKIGFDAKRLFNNFTGLGNYSRTLVSNLQKYYPENDYHLFTNEITLNEQTEAFTKPPYIVHQPSNPLERILYRTAQQSKAVNTLKLDIYHGLSHELPYGVSADTKTIVTFHDLIYEKLPSHFGYFDRWLYQKKYNSSALRSDRIIAISNETKSDLERIYKIPEGKISVVYQSLSQSFVDHPIQDQKELYYLYVGSIIQRKGLKTLIEAVSRLAPGQRYKTVVIGEGKKYKEECLGLIQKKKLEPWFDLNGNISNDTLFKYYDDCIALVLPSECEGFGIPIIEALYRQKPVITTKDSAMAEAAGPGGILIDANHPDQLAQALIDCIEKDKHHKLSTEGYAYVTHKFNGQTTAKDLIEIYKTTISGMNKLI